MTMRDFLKEHATEIDKVITAELYKYDGNGGRGTPPTPTPRYTDKERRLWIANNEGLYCWARSKGVRV